MHVSNENYYFSSWAGVAFYQVEAMLIEEDLKGTLGSVMNNSL